MKVTIPLQVEIDDKQLELAIDKYVSENPNFAEVVRCKDCYYYNENRGICTNTACIKSFYGCKVKEDDFCSYGERKKDNNA